MSAQPSERARVEENSVKLLSLQSGQHILPAAKEEPGPFVPAFGHGVLVHVWMGFDDGVATRAMALYVHAAMKQRR